MYTPATSRHFSKQTDPSGAVYYVLDTHVAARQQGFYFVNSSMSDDGRYLWFYTFYPPARYRTLGVVDFEKDEVYNFPETCFPDASPIVDAQGNCWYTDTVNLYKRSPDPDVPVEIVQPLPPELSDGHSAILMYPCCHLTFSPDKKQVFLDAINSRSFVVGTMELETGRFTEWCRPEYYRNHGQYNPVYPGVALTAEDFGASWNGERRGIRCDENGVFLRLWLVREDGTQEVIPPLDGMRATHEWWSADGRKVYYCRYELANVIGGVRNNGVCCYDIFTGDHKLVAPVPAWHAFTSADEQLIVYDENAGFYRGCESRVGLYNVKTGRQVYIVTLNEAMALPEKPSQYHLDPHPRFNAGEKYIVFTAVKNGDPQVAVAFTEDILPLTQ